MQICELEDELEQGGSATSVPQRCISYVAMQALYEMRLSNTLCDATIHQDEFTFRVHRAILSSCSDYFRTLFTTSVPSEKDTITIAGIRGAIMERIIKYAYLRECDVREEDMFEMYAAADYLGMASLQERCIQYIKKVLRPSNAVVIMLYARQRMCPQLYAYTRAYIMRHFVEISRRCADLMNLELDDLYELLSDETLNVKDEEMVWQCCVRWIKHDPGSRAQHVAKLMKAVRLGLLRTQFFMDEVKENPFVTACDATKPIVIEALTFLYDLDMVNSTQNKIKTPSIAMPRLPHDVIFTFGGWSEGLPQSVIETYDTRADRWVKIDAGNRTEVRAYYGAATIGPMVYCIGGYDGVEHFNTCRRFDAVEKVWTEIAPMHSRRCYVSVVELSGLIYAMGGYDGHNRQNTAEVYNPRTNQWTMINPMNHLRSDADACTLEGKIYIVGGFNGQECLSTAEVYDPRENAWTLLPNMHNRRSGVSCIAHKGTINVIGGFNGIARMSSCERYDPCTNRWREFKDMYHQRSNFGIEVIDDMIFAIGGYDGAVAISQTECYVAETNEWLEATDLNQMRSAFKAVIVSGLPNVRDYIHKDRESLITERRQKIHVAEQEGDFIASLSASTINDVD
ncbi:kelch-like protein 10 [Culex quinquefasciatus]|uniref:kelch-like protein 10 n=1 Tax=Culex quinquefasciatus TaxID=7176 RepID=UPI0018E3D9BB|nr:kelch-like protein 10 [Culex quinquefasciatus]XP_039439778.1 kelch-like protein 10 [Culex pipiens pallens]